MLLDWTYTPYTIPLFIAAAVSGILFIPAWRRRDAPGAKAFAWFSALAALWCFGYAVEIGSPTFAGKLFWAKFQYIGIVNVSPVFIVFCLQYTRRWRFSSKSLVVFFILPWLLLLSVWLEPNLGLFYRSLSRGKELAPFLYALALFGLCLVGLGISIWPDVIPARVSIWEAAAPPRSQLFMLVGAVIMVPIILVYTAWAYWVFRGKVGHEGYH